MKAKKLDLGSKRGQGIVEFALAFPVFLLIILGIFEFGRLFFTYATVFTASREAARYGATVDNANDCPGMVAAARNVAFYADLSNIDIYYDNGSKDLQAVTRATNPESALSGLNLIPCSSSANPVLGDRIIVLVSSRYMPVVGPMVGIKQDFVISSLVSRTLVKEVKWEAPTQTPTP